MPGDGLVVSPHRSADGKQMLLSVLALEIWLLPSLLHAY